MIDVNNWVKERRPIVYPLDADGRGVRLKKKVDDDDEMTPSQSWAKTAVALKLFRH